MMSDMDRDDLAAQLSRLTRRLGAAERPLLEVHGLSMWSYIALGRLASRPADTQLELAGAMGYDKTRLIRLLDSLEGEGLVTRDPDPADRRARVVRLTAMGAQRHAAARDAIRAMEATFLEPLPPDDRESF